jgi:hypothetical protein
VDFCKREKEVYTLAIGVNKSNIMDINNSASIGSLTAQTGQAPDAVNITVLKKAIDLQAQAAVQLIEALPQVTSNPANLGQSVDIRA